MLECINQKYMKILFEIEKNQKKPKNLTELVKKSGVTAATLSNLINRWVREQVLIKQKAEGGRGNDSNVILTKYGQEQIKKLKELYKNHKNKEKILELNQEVKNGDG